MKQTFCLLLFGFFLCGCVPDSDRLPDVSGIPMSVRIRRLEREIFGLRSKDEVTSFLDANPLFAENFLQRSAAPDDSVVVNQLYRMVTDEHLDTLYRQTQTVFADLSGLEAEFADAFRHVKHYYPAFRAPEIHTLVTGFGSDLFVSDSLVVIGLDFYLGDRGRYRPNVPNYLQRRYRPEYLVPSAIALLSQSYNATDPGDKSLLAEMIFYGKAYEFTQAMRPNAPDSLLIGYTGKQLADTEANQAVVWAHFVEKKLL
ncbi:MAG: gliding motility lipoprotein GldB, partial [Ferruginibacter sp.]|nr:gliding motility lipoprotein GldB [Cytophagales bacterium]